MNGNYIISAIDPQNGKHNLYHDEMRGSIAAVVSAEIGDGALIRYTPEYDNRPHYVTTSTVKSVKENDNSLVIETNNTIYTFQAVKQADFTSVLDGGVAVTTNCKVNMATKEVFDIEVSEGTADMVNNLDEEYVTIDGEQFPVSNEKTEGGYWYN